jgi:thiol-disulfide isomerase/thioredoxin
MKTNDLIVLIILLFILLTPSESTQVIAKPNIADEGMVAVQVANTKFNVEESITPIALCKCNGTKKETSGDGLLTFPCVCGDSCKCKSNNTPIDIDVKVYPKQTYYFTAEWCVPCRAFKRKEVPELQSKGWIVSDDEGSHIRVIDVDKRSDLYKKFGKERTIPLFLLLKDGSEVDSIVGSDKTTAKDITDMWYK